MSADHEKEHVFSLEGRWSGGVKSVGHIHGGAVDADISSPSAFGGPGKGTNPEELLLASASTCYLITLAAICERREIPVTGIALTSEIRVSPPPAVKVLGIIHHPTLTLEGQVSDEGRENALDAALRAERVCMVSNALRGNVEVKVEAKIAG